MTFCHFSNRIPKDKIKIKKNPDDSENLEAISNFYETPGECDGLLNLPTPVICY